MREHGPSRTAAGVAFRRAAHQILDRPPVFADPLAKAVLSEEAQARLVANPIHGNQGMLSTRLRAFLAVRSRVAEDRVAQAVADGVHQYVILGAGLDTFAYRNPFPGLRVFEVDHPGTQDWKLGRLKAAGLTASPGTTFVPVDFERQSAVNELIAHGLDPARPTALSWLGVVPYLDEPTVWATLEWAAGIVGERGCIVFDYASPPEWWQLGRRMALRRLAARVAAAGEPFRTLLQPSHVKDRLSSVGFSTVVDLDAAELNRRYFGERTDGLQVGGGGHVVIASRSHS